MVEISYFLLVWSVKERRGKRNGSKDSFSDPQRSVGQNSSDQELKFIYSSRATRTYQNRGISSKVQKRSVDPQFCPSTLTFYPMDVTLTHRSHMAPLGPHLTLVGFRASSGLVCGPLSAYVVHFKVSSWQFFFY